MMLLIGDSDACCHVTCILLIAASNLELVFRAGDVCNAELVVLWVYGIPR